MMAGMAIQGELHEIKRNYVRDRLVVRTEQPDRIQAELGERCTVMEDEGLMIQLDSANDKKSMMAHLIEQYDIDEVKVFEPSLNDIFVEYAGTEGGAEMKQFWKILKFEMKYYFRNKVFVGVTVFLMLLIAGVMFFPRLNDTFLGGTDDKESSELSGYACKG